MKIGNISALGLIDTPIDPSRSDRDGNRGDQLAIDPYYKGLAEFISYCQTPMTIAIQGDWGSGKTTALNFIRAALEERQAKVVEFNTWQYAQFDLGEALIFSMIHEITAPLVQGSEAARKFLGAAIKLGKSVASAGLRSAGKATGFGFATDAILDSLASTASGDEGENLVKQVKDLREQFESAVSDYCKKNDTARIVVMIDDLDRLDPSRAVEVMEALKVFFECPRCVFVLAIDFEVVSKGVREKYGKDFKNKKARAFFDKIIQVPFQMPIASYEVRGILADALTESSESDSKYLSLYMEAAAFSVGSNPRSIKRLINTFELIRLIAQTRKAKSENEVEDNEKLNNLIIFILLCAQTSYPKWHEHLESSISSNRERVRIGRLLDAVSSQVSQDEDEDLTPSAVNARANSAGSADDQGGIHKWLPSENFDTPLEFAKRFGVRPADTDAFVQFVALLADALRTDSEDDQVDVSLLASNLKLSAVTAVGSGGSGVKSDDEAKGMATTVEERNQRIFDHGGEIMRKLVEEIDQVLIGSGERTVVSSAQTRDAMLSYYAASDLSAVLDLAPRNRKRFMAVQYAPRAGLKINFGRYDRIRHDESGTRYAREWDGVVDRLTSVYPDVNEKGQKARDRPRFRILDTRYPLQIENIHTISEIRDLADTLIEIYDISNA